MSIPSGVIKTYNLQASYVSKYKRTGQRTFQNDLADFSKSPDKRIAILQAATGAGKTFAFRILAPENGKVMIVLPNNLLASEVADDIGKEARVLNKDAIQQENLKKINEINPRHSSRSETVESIINNHKFIITNPTVFYYLLINHYTAKSKEDMLSILVKRLVTHIVFDEFHIYSVDQVSMILAGSLMIPDRIKIIFSSATPPFFFDGISREVFKSHKIESISTKRLYQKSRDVDLIQGPLELNIVNLSGPEFVRKNVDVFKEGTWVFIADSIKNVHKIAETLLQRYDEAEMAILSGYNDPTYSIYSELKNNPNSKRILICTNIIEQGINLGKNFSNFVIEPGLTEDSTIQRLGRVGRGVERNSQVFLCFSYDMQTFQDNIENFDELIKSLRTLKYNKNKHTPKAWTIGVYSAIMMTKLTENAVEVIRENILNYENETLNSGIFKFENINLTLRNSEGRKKLKKNCLKEIDKVFDWFMAYVDTFYEFIHSGDKIDIDDDNFGGRFLRTKYDEIWARKNKEIIRSGGTLYVGKFLDRVNYDFKVLVTNLPMGPRLMKYGDISFNSWQKINEDLEKLLSDIMCEENEKVSKFIDDIKVFTKATAGIERLSLEVKNGE